MEKENLVKHQMKTTEDKPEKSDKVDTITEQFLFKSRFVLVFGEINHTLVLL